VSLIQSWQKDEVAAFEALFLRYKDMVMRTAISMLDDAGEAEDVLQMAFIRVYQLKEKFKGDETGFRRWLYRITINLCIDVQRKRHPTLRLEHLIGKGNEPAVDFSASGLEAKDELSRVLRGLESKQRAVVVLRFLHDLSYEEIARTLDIPLGTVKSRLNTAMKTLQKKVLEERGDNL
jgi:RNA polymerase sigma-70 factor (ECF subfamily)